MTRRAGRLLATLAITLVAVACGVTNDTRAKEIPGNQLPFNLAETTTSSTTLPPTTTPGTTAPLATTTTPTTAVPSFGQTLYFLVGGKVRPVERTVDQRPTLDTAVGLLANGPLPSEDPVLTTLVGVGLVQGIDRSGGTAIVTVGPPYDALDPISQLLVTAQLVFTLTDLPGVGRVSYVEGGNPIPMWLADGSQTDQSISQDDYATLLA